MPNPHDPRQVPAKPRQLEKPESQPKAAQMHDFRVNTNRRRQFIEPRHKYSEFGSNTLAQQAAKIMRKGSGHYNELEPIAENQEAHIVHLMKKYQGALPQ